MGDTSHIKVSHSLSTIVATITLVLSLIGSWSWFYSEQRLNSQEISMLREDKAKSNDRISKLEALQTKMIITVDNNSKTIGEVSESVKEIAKILNDNQKYLIKIVNKNRLE